MAFVVCVTFRDFEDVVPAAGVEPATFRSGGERSNPLSYAGVNGEPKSSAMLGDASNAPKHRAKVSV